jgi:hypothetical protein
MGTTTLEDETTLPPPTAPAARCAIVGSGTREDDEDEEDEEIERDKQGQGGDEHDGDGDGDGDGDEEDEEDDDEDEGGADYSRSYIPSGDGSRAIPGVFAEP